MSGGDQAVGVIASVMCLVVVGSALLARRLEGRAMLKLALIWAAIIFGVVAVIRLLGIS